MKILTILIGEKKFGLPISLIREIIDEAKYTPAERAPEDILGLMNLRGQIVTLLCPGVSFGYEKKIKDRTWAVVLKRNSDLNKLQKKEAGQNGVADDLYAFEVDGVADVVDFPAEMDPIPGNSPKEESIYLTGIARTNDIILPVLNVSALISQGSTTEEKDDE